MERERPDRRSTDVARMGDHRRQVDAPARDAGDLLARGRVQQRLALVVRAEPGPGHVALQQCTHRSGPPLADIDDRSSTPDHDTRGPGRPGHVAHLGARAKARPERIPIAGCRPGTRPMRPGQRYGDARLCWCRRDSTGSRFTKSWSVSDSTFTTLSSRRRLGTYAAAPTGPDGRTARCCGTWCSATSSCGGCSPAFACSGGSPMGTAAGSRQR